MYSNKPYDLVGQYLSSLCYEIGIALGIQKSRELSRFTLCLNQNIGGTVSKYTNTTETQHVQNLWITWVSWSMKCKQYQLTRVYQLFVLWSLRKEIVHWYKYIHSFAFVGDGKNSLVKTLNFLLGFYNMWFLCLVESFTEITYLTQAIQALGGWIGKRSGRYFKK